MKRIAQIFSDSDEEQPGFKPAPKRTSDAGRGKFVNPAMSDAGKNVFKFKKEPPAALEVNEKKRKHIEAFKEAEDPPSKRRPQ